MQTVDIGYHLTTFSCKHHRPKLEMKFNSPKSVVEVQQFLMCPQCKRIGGMTVTKQEKKESYSVPTSF